MDEEMIPRLRQKCLSQGRAAQLSGDTVRRSELLKQTVEYSIVSILVETTRAKALTVFQYPRFTRQ